MRGSWIRWAVAVALCAGCSSPAGKQAENRQGSDPSNGVTLSPNPAFAASRIDAVFDDRWIDPAKCRFVWKRNGLVIEGARGSSLEPSHFAKGERVSVQVTLVDPAGGKSREMTASVDVVNTPPKVTGAALSLATVGGSAVVQANVQSADLDGDDISLEYKWFRNDAPVPGAGPTLAMQSLARGDRVAVEVVASDGQSTSGPSRSEALAIDNRPPVFTSQPRVPRPTDKEFRYKADAVDGDGDPVRYELVSAPEGMTVDPTGMIVWPLPAQSQRQVEYPVRIRATDLKGGEAVQEFSVRLDGSPR